MSLCPNNPLRMTSIHSLPIENQLTLIEKSKEAKKLKVLNAFLYSHEKPILELSKKKPEVWLHFLKSVKTSKNQELLKKFDSWIFTEIIKNMIRLRPPIPFQDLLSSKREKLKTYRKKIQRLRIASEPPLELIFNVFQKNAKDIASLAIKYPDDWFYFSQQLRSSHVMLASTLQVLDQHLLRILSQKPSSPFSFVKGKPLDLNLIHQIVKQLPAQNHQEIVNSIEQMKAIYSNTPSCYIFDRKIPIDGFTEWMNNQRILFLHLDFKDKDLYYTLPHVESLDLSPSPHLHRPIYTESEIYSILSRSTNLRRLCLPSYITGLEPLTKLPCPKKLEELEIHASCLKIDLSILKNFPHLKKLSIFSPIAMGTFKIISSLVELECLELGYCHVLDNLYHLKSLPNLTTFISFGCNLLDEDLVPLASLRQLKKLYLSGNRDLSPRALEIIGKLNGLEKLTLSNSPQISQLNDLKHLQHLKSLNLSSCSISDHALKCLNQFPHLVELDLAKTAISDKGIAALGLCPHLKILNLADTGITDHGLSQLHSLIHLEFLNLRNCKINGSGFKNLGMLDKLETISLAYSTTFTTESLEYIKKLKNLKKFDVYSPKMR